MRFEVSGIANSEIREIIVIQMLNGWYWEACCAARRVDSVSALAAGPELLKSSGLNVPLKRPSSTL